MLGEVQRVTPVTAAQRVVRAVPDERGAVAVAQDLRQLRGDLGDDVGAFGGERAALHTEPVRVEALGYGPAVDQRGEQGGLPQGEPLPGPLIVRAAGPRRRDARRYATARRRGSCRDRLADGVEFGGQLRGRREVVVALQQHAGRRGTGAQLGQYVEHRPGDGVGVGVVPDPVALDTAGDMDVRDGLDRQFVERGRRVLTAVDVVGVQIGDVDQQPDAGALHQFGEELALAHLLVGPADQRGDVLHCERHRQRVLGDAHVLAEHPQRVLRARHRQQMTGLQAGRSGQRAAGPDERDVLGDQRRAERLRPFGEVGQPPRIGPVGAAEPERDAVRDDGDAPLAQSDERVRQMVGAEVLGDRLDPVDPVQRLDGVRDLRAPADADPQLRCAVGAFHVFLPRLRAPGVMARPGGAEPAAAQAQRLI
ncbi:hypothetical protein HY68_23970 [Streptomyces sp. AcH 505]|nr:hypothetical protein HY68_23970 [Streptomyces sp. AcH 505]